MIKKIIKFVYSSLKEERPILYKIGKKKHHNAKIDDLTPQFIEIGENFISGPGALVLSHDASLLNKYGKYRVEKTIIGDDVFLGAGAIVLPGIEVSNGAIIGAGAIVTKNVPPHTVVAGNPAKVVATVEDYYNKMNEKGVLYDATDNIVNNWKKRRSTYEEKREFQERTVKEAKKRGVLN